MVKISWSKSALKDLKNIHDYISKDSFLYASRTISKIITAVDQLEAFPYSGRMVPEKNDETIREVFQGDYRIFYKVQTPNQIHILRIHHSARNVK